MVGALGLEVLEFTPGFLFACCFSSGLEDLLCLVTKCNTLKKGANSCTTYANITYLSSEKYGSIWPIYLSAEYLS